MTTIPNNDYDLAGWAAFYAANPHLRRSVGAAGDEGDDAGEGSEDAGETDTGDTSGETEGDEARQSKDTDNSDEGEGGKDGDDADGAEYTANDFAMPEGVELDEAMMTDFLAVANNQELTGKDRDQALVDLYAKKQGEATDAQYQQWEDTRTGWLKEAKADKEIGGKQFDENMGLAKKAMSKFGSKELQEFGTHYGWADHPEYLKLLVRVGATLSEGKAPRGGAKNEGGTIADRWYGDDDGDT
jgi:hypothetical protein